MVRPTYRIKFVPYPDLMDIRAIRAGLSQFNVQHVPSLASLPDDDIAIFIRDTHDNIQGGLVAEVDWGMMYVDLLWLDDSLRGKGYGRALIKTIEQVSYQKGIPHIYLMTTEFQALPFYQHMGYTLFGTLLNRPHGYAYYYLHKRDLQPDNTDYGLTVTHQPTRNDIISVNRGLRNYCEQYVDCTSDKLAIFIYDDHGTIKGGIYGATYWDWYDLRYLWLSDEIKGRGYGKQLLQQAEAECRRRGVTGIVCDTTDFQALPFYQSQGFEVFATLKDRPPDHTSYFIKKLLT